MPITRQGMHPDAGWYGFLDPKYKDCSFGLHPSEDGVQGGAVTTRNCEKLLPRLAQATRWQPPAMGNRWDPNKPMHFDLRGKTRYIGTCANAWERLRLMLFERDFNISDRHVRCFSTSTGWTHPTSPARCGPRRAGGPSRSSTCPVRTMPGSR